MKGMEDTKRHRRFTRISEQRVGVVYALRALISLAILASKVLYSLPELFPDSAVKSFAADDKQSVRSTPQAPRRRLFSSLDS